MPVLELDTWQFRNLQPGRLSFAPGVNLLVGANGQGKTNVLEALYLSCLSRSFRTSRLAECVTHGQSGFRVASRWTGRAWPVNLEVRWVDGVRELRRDGQPAELPDFLAEAGVLCVTADHLRVINGGPEERRRFFDGLLALFEPDFLRVLVECRRVLRQKSALLRSGRARPESVRPWNRRLVDLAGVMAARRQGLLDALAPALERERLSGAALSVQYRPSLAGGEDREAETERLDQRLADECRVGRCLAGPHLDRYGVYLEGRDVRRYASSGQKRSVLLSLYLAALERFERVGRGLPVVLIDDVDMELDPERIHRLLNCLVGRTQLFLSSAKASLFQDQLADRQMWRVQDGRVVAS